MPQKSNFGSPPAKPGVYLGEIMCISGMTIVPCRLSGIPTLKAASKVPLAAQYPVDLPEGKGEF